MTHHEVWLHLADHIHHPVLRLTPQIQRIIPHVKEADVLHPQRGGGIFGLLPARGLDPLQRHAFLLPQLGALAALAIGQAHNRDLIPLLLMQRDRAPRPPDKIGGMRADDQGGFLVGHGQLLRFGPWPAWSGPFAISYRSPTRLAYFEIGSQYKHML